jgi:hypothetical protein
MITLWMAGVTEVSSRAGKEAKLMARQDFLSFPMFPELAQAGDFQGEGDGIASSRRAGTTGEKTEASHYRGLKVNLSRVLLQGSC